MEIYSDISSKFSSDVVKNEIVPKIIQAFYSYYGRIPGLPEQNSWRNSLQYIQNIIEYNKLLENYIVIEYELPYCSSRIDCMLFGKNEINNNVVILELKQWTDVKACDFEDEVEAFTAGAYRILQHPSIQVRSYVEYLRDMKEIFSQDSLWKVYGASYCHNYDSTKNYVLKNDVFTNILNDYPLFDSLDFGSFSEYLNKLLYKGNGIEIHELFSKSRIRPSRRLLDYTKNMIDNQKVFYLIDEQLTANNVIIDRAKKCSKTKRKTVIIVKGGPGTGKSVIALNVMAELINQNPKPNIRHIIGSKTFRETLIKILGRNVESIFTYTNKYSPAVVEENEIDCLICDEAHRIRKSSNSRFTSKAIRSDITQIEELIRVAKLSVFFIDDKQIIKPDEIGNSSLIEQTAHEMGADVFIFELSTQFRCNGSDGYLSWIENTLELGIPSLKMLDDTIRFDFRIFNSPKELYEEILEKNAIENATARLVAGFCWPWSLPKTDGTLENDVVIGDFKMPWEGHEQCRLAPRIPKWFLWGTDPNGINQIGCIYTAQGLEFDYIGVIFGPDLIYRESKGGWCVDIDKNYDSHLNRKLHSDRITEYLKNIYRVLLTRGMKGCFVYFVDKETEIFVRSRICKFSME